MKTQTVKFPGADGNTLTGLIDRPAGTPRGYALFAHCFTCTKNLKAATNIAKALAAEGLATLRFDFTGLGQSEGEFAETNFSSNVADLVAAAEFLEREHTAPAVLVGHSLGGAAALQAAGEIDSVVAVATIAAPARPAHVTKMFKDKRTKIEETGEAEVQLAGRPFTIRKQFLDDLESHGLPESIGKLRKALLIFHSPLDDTVEVQNASELFTHAKHPKSFVSLDKADHLLSREEDSRYVGRVLAAWAGKYLESDAPKPDVSPKSGDENVDASAGENAGEPEVVARTDAGAFLTEMRVAGHEMLADEPESYGGTDRGPTPYDYLSAALASCTAMTVQLYAGRKDHALETVTVRVRHSKIHAKDCEECETREGKLDRFERSIALEGDLSDDARKALIDIADRCPVHRTLHSEVSIKTTEDSAT